MEVAERIRTRSAQLTSAERRVAEAILDAPQAVAFGTVAELAGTAGVGAASVVRLASKLGFDGYTELQACVRGELSHQLRPAAERIHESDDAASTRQVAAMVRNVTTTVGDADPEARARVVARLADLDRPVVVVSGEASFGIAAHFVGQVCQLRDGVRLLAGTDVAVRRELAVLPAVASGLVVDLRRYERWVLDAHAALTERGIWTAGFTDSMLSPIAARADEAFVVRADAVGPFDSHVGTLALLDLLVVELATALRESATERLAAIEAAWRRSDSLTEPI